MFHIKEEGLLKALRKLDVCQNLKLQEVVFGHYVRVFTEIYHFYQER